MSYNYVILWIHDTICIFMYIYIHICICMCIYIYICMYIRYIIVFKCFANSREYHSFSWCCAGFWCPSQGWRRADSYTSMVRKRRANWGPHCYHSSLIETVAKMECWAPIKHPEQPVSIQRVQRGFKDEYQPIILSLISSSNVKCSQGWEAAARPTQGYGYWSWCCTGGGAQMLKTRSKASV